MNLDNAYFVKITPERLTIDFGKNEFLDLKLKKEKYIMDEEVSDGKRDILLIVIESYKSPTIHGLYFFKDILLESKKERENDLLIIKFSKLDLKKTFDLTDNKELKNIILKNAMYHQLYIDKHLRAYGVGILKNLLYEESDLNKLKSELENIEKKFILTIQPFKKILNTFQLPKEIFTRHILVLGETGSGKTYSVMFPVLNALKDKLGKFSALIIDPKLNELKNAFMKI